MLQAQKPSEESLDMQQIHTMCSRDEFNERRVPRAKFVAEASLQLAQWLLDHEQGDVPGLVAQVVKLVSQPV